MGKIKHLKKLEFTTIVTFVFSGLFAIIAVLNAFNYGVDGLPVTIICSGVAIGFGYLAIADTRT